MGGQAQPPPNGFGGRAYEIRDLGDQIVVLVPHFHVRFIQLAVAPDHVLMKMARGGSYEQDGVKVLGAGVFEQTMALPVLVDPRTAEVSDDNGVMSLVIEKAEKQKKLSPSSKELRRLRVEEAESARRGHTSGGA
jgi:HSP20 family molecular chaperone IbpA